MRQTTSSARSGPSAKALDPAAIAGIERIRRDPAAFMRTFLGADLWEKQVEIAESVRDHRRTSVRSCHGIGKSFLSARIIIWFLHAYPSSIVVSTAPTANQVVNIIWREVGAAYASRALPLLGRCLTQRYEIAPDWYALGFKAEDTATDSFQGFHAEHALVVIDEAAGVADTVFHALNAVLTSEAARLLFIGNPTSTDGTFYDSFHKSRALYHTIAVEAADTPNMRAGETVRPYLITQQWIDEAIAEHGEDSPYVQSRVYARFPAIGENTLIPLSWLEPVPHREMPEGGEWHAGVDVARFGGDENAICIRRGSRIVHQDHWNGMDLMETVGKVRSVLADYPPMESVKVDVIGLGAGVADRLREENYPVVDVNVGAASSDNEQWLNLRCELWWQVRERFRAAAIAGPLDDVTMGQLSSIRYKYDSRHTKPVIESKEDAKRLRKVKSPDRAEAVMLAFATLSTGPGLPMQWITQQPDFRKAHLPQPLTDEERAAARLADYLRQQNGE